MAALSNGAHGFEGGLPTLLTNRKRAEHAPQKAAPQKPRGRQPVPCAAIELPEEIEAGPPGLCVKNTFLEAAEPRPPSLEPFYRERSVRTCPGAQAGILEGLFREGAGTSGAIAPAPPGFAPALTSPAAYMPPTPWADSAPACWADAAPARTVVSLVDMLDLPAAAVPCAERERLAGCRPVCPPQALPPQTGHVLLGAPPAPAPPRSPALEPEGLPSVGSALHSSGQCKPCAFLHTRGCENGASCQFCHLCDSEERKKRRQAKLEAQRAARKDKKAALGGL